MNTERAEKLRLLILGDKANKEADETINAILGITESRLLSIIQRHQKRMGTKDDDLSEEIPPNLEWVADEVVIKRFNRLGSEGYSSQSVEGHSIAFRTDDFAEYDPYILDYLEDQEAAQLRQGRLVIY